MLHSSNKFVGELGELADEFLKLAQAQTGINLKASPNNLTWSDYFQRNVYKPGTDISQPPLARFTPEPMDHLAMTIGKQPLSQQLQILMRSMICNKSSLEKLLQYTTESTDNNLGYLRENIEILRNQL
ncbi:hypothetical protein KFU94_44940 [Chloroflexi bacterium TSY]|nr:hypothetical protein [Chloroflexi bacterium TSY]